ncbi:MAG TPA: hypothetical protein VHE23_05900, partial [Candidatus Acidoferrales bacterium]|nr:hypothetical protein [Candidatus Acidoferrales bacterium]
RRVCSTYGARDSLCYVSQPSRAGLSSGAPARLQRVLRPPALFDGKRAAWMHPIGPGAVGILP